MSETQKFRVAVVTIWEVESTDFRDAANVAEGAVRYVIDQMSESAPGDNPVVRWHHHNGHDYEATLVRLPLEVKGSLMLGTITIGVDQPSEDEER